MILIQEYSNYIKHIIYDQPIIIMSSQQCVGLTKNSTLCRKSTRNGCFCHLHKSQKPADINGIIDIRFCFIFVKKQILSGISIDSNDDMVRTASLLSLRKKIEPILKKAEDVKFIILFDRCIQELAYHPSFMNQRIKDFDDIEDFFESMGY